MKFFREKGQVLVEFALALPMFLMLVFGIMYSGMLFYDYSTLSNTARSAARERAITASDVEDETIISHYFDVEKNEFVNKLTTSLYHPAPNNAFVMRTENEDVLVVITMELTRNNSYVMRMVAPNQFSIGYHMRVDGSRDEHTVSAGEGTGEGTGGTGGTGNTGGTGETGGSTGG